MLGSVIRRMIGAGLIGLCASIGQAADEEKETEASPHCEDVEITIKNASGQAIKLIGIDYQTTGRWSRGKIVFTTIDDGASHTWSGSFKDMAGKAARFRVNTRYVIDDQTGRYSDLNSTTVSTAACASQEKHGVEVGKPQS